ncbi:MAG: HAMP domain-containing protein [Alphaproteobacteria bacterium]|nr:HAMP domain-containing protein [Alphaproteobacteria bacterium]
MPRPGLSPWKPSGFRLLFASVWRGTTTARIGILLFLVLLAATWAPLILLERATQSQLDKDAQTRITAIADAAETAWQRRGASAGWEILDGELQVPGPLVIMLVDADGTLLIGNLRRWPAEVPPNRRYYRVAGLAQEHGDPGPYMATARPMPEGYRLLVGRSLAADVQLQRTLVTTLLLVLPFALLIALVTSRVITRIITDRARGLADAVRQVTAGKLDARVDVPPGPPADAFDSMGQAFNVMLARVEGLIDELRTVTDGLAHDLRSPLTRLKARIGHMAVGTTISADDLDAVAVEAQALLAMLDNSLEISRAEAGIGRDRFETLDLAQMIAELADLYDPLAEDAGVTLEVVAPGPVVMPVHRQLLGRALANLIDNALRYGASGRRIEVGVGARDGGAMIWVADHGPGIPASRRREALRRYGRLDTARRAQRPGMQGAGLGLSLAGAVARLHGGTLALDDNKPGLKVILDLPATPAVQ